MKKQVTPERKTRQHVAGFVRNITDGNYSSAQESLKNAVESKLKQRLSKAKDINIF
jgi:hypothetical protein